MRSQSKFNMNQSKQKQNNRSQTYKDYRFWNYSDTEYKISTLKKQKRKLKYKIMKSMRQTRGKKTS